MGNTVIGLVIEASIRRNNSGGVHNLTVINQVYCSEVIDNGVLMSEVDLFDAMQEALQRGEKR